MPGNTIQVKKLQNGYKSCNMSAKGSESMKKFRMLAAFIVICSLMLIPAQASAPIQPKIVFGDSLSDPALDADQPASETDAFTGSKDENSWFSAIEGFFSMTVLEETAASALPDAAEQSEQDAMRTVYNDGTTFVSVRDFIETLQPEAVFSYKDGVVTVAHTDMYMELHDGKIYCYANGRMLPVSDPCFEADDVFYAPIRLMAQIYGYDVAWDEALQTVTLTENGEVLLSGEDFYDPEDYMLLARLINAESGNQSLEGKIAVGNVIMNRIADSRFPDTISDVIYDRSCGVQFTTAYNGSLNKKPNAESYIAAKLCLEGYSVTDDCLYFLNPSISGRSWVTRNRPYVMTIGDHAFFS